MDELCKTRHTLIGEAMEYSLGLVKDTLSSSDLKALKALVNKINKLDRDIAKLRQTDKES
jgi:hypothetical protein